MLKKLEFPFFHWSSVEAACHYWKGTWERCELRLLRNKGMTARHNHCFLSWFPIGSPAEASNSRMNIINVIHTHTQTGIQARGRGNSVPIHTTCTITYKHMAINLKWFCIQTQKYRAIIATVFLKIHLYCGLLNMVDGGVQEFKINAVNFSEAQILLSFCWLCWSVCLYLVLSNFLFSSLIFLPDCSICIFLSMYPLLCGLASEASNGSKNQKKATERKK